METMAAPVHTNKYWESHSQVQSNVILLFMISTGPVNEVNVQE